METAAVDEEEAVVTAVAALLEARRLSGEAWVWNESHFDRLAGDGELRLAIERGDDLQEIVGAWAGDRLAFEELRRPYLIY